MHGIQIRALFTILLGRNQSVINKPLQIARKIITATSQMDSCSCLCKAKNSVELGYYQNFYVMYFGFERGASEVAEGYFVRKTAKFLKTAKKNSLS